MSALSPGRVRVDRRTTIRWLASAMFAATSGCTSNRRFVGEEIPPPPDDAALLRAAPPPATGYGGDPDLINPVVPWPRTMTDAELDIATRLGDIILPADGRSPAASAVGVPDFIDEWVSAPYPQQQRDRTLLLAGFEWLDRQSRRQFGVSFAAADNAQTAQLVDNIARHYPDDHALREQADFFDRFRYLAVGAFYTSREGIADIGYLGNVVVSGNYPGPSDAAMRHLLGVLRQLDLPAP